ncbi:dethiobiotin synthase [Arenimonas sp.]|uniref:dethiobiotin synthase n=1 Tax=Arenimonas sp. TaxID=1872635 RepID=UPI002D7FEC9C|nr:dethiobiotin synthase [Arenimonas sp.]
MSSRGVFITGTDTDAGKTVASAALVHALRRGGRRVVGMKPVASGCESTPDGWRNADALALQAASDPVPAYALVNPVALRDPTAPQLAARAVGAHVTLPPLLAAYRDLAAMADQVVVEGVGGWLAPLADELDQSALVKALDLPVILVVGLKLGCLNHARLTARAIAADGCRLLGWIGSTVEPGFPPAYLDLVHAALPVPCLGVLPHAPGASAAERAASLLAR